MYFFFKMSIYSCDASESRSWVGLVADPRGETLQNSDSSSAVAGKEGRYIYQEFPVNEAQIRRRAETELVICICNCGAQSWLNLSCLQVHTQLSSWIPKCLCWPIYSTIMCKATVTSTGITRWDNMAHSNNHVVVTSQSHGTENSMVPAHKQAPRPVQHNNIGAKT